MTLDPTIPISTTAAPTDDSGSAPPLPALHDAAQQAQNLRQILEDDKVRIGYFLGAGCPLGIFDERGEKSVLLISSVKGLTLDVAAGLAQVDKDSEGTHAPTRFKAQWDALHAECESSAGSPPTVEDILSEMRTLASRRGTSPVLGFNRGDFHNLDVAICKLILAAMKRNLPPYRCSYHRLASWAAGASRLFPLEIFTPNYDLLLEQAFEGQQQPHFDGFVGSREPFFDLSSIEHDIIPSRWVRIWKLHGSINWERLEESTNGETVTRVIRVAREADAQKVMIYPSHLKYDQSRKMPYLAMMDRVRAFFHPASAGSKATDRDQNRPNAPRLVICGYSFLDDHLNEALLDGLRGNRDAHCFALMYSDLADHPRVVEHATRQGNLTVLARDGAVIGTRKGAYRSGVGGISDHNPWLYEEEGPRKAVTSRLGDFHYFTLFLEQLCGHHA